MYGQHVLREGNSEREGQITLHYKKSSNTLLDISLFQIL